jgi:hypothetical protein
MPQETEEIKLKATDLLVKHSAHLLQIENQRTESTILHQLVALIQQSEFRQIVERHRHLMLLPVVVKQTHADQPARTTDVVLTQSTKGLATGLLGTNQSVLDVKQLRVQEMQRPDEDKQILEDRQVRMIEEAQIERIILLQHAA